MPQDTLKCYEVLGLQPGASANSIRQSYLNLIQTWDPERHNDNPRLRAETEKKRTEIDEAYNTIKHFLTELQAPPGVTQDEPRFTRDYEELAVKPKVDISRGILGLLAAAVLLGIFLLSLRLFKVGKSFTPAPQIQPVQE